MVWYVLSKTVSRTDNRSIRDSDLARLAPDAGGDVDQLGDAVIARRIEAGTDRRVGIALICRAVAHYAFSV